MIGLLAKHQVEADDDIQSSSFRKEEAHFNFNAVPGCGRKFGTTLKR
jgi:hypothetical protein